MQTNGFCHVNTCIFPYKLHAESPCVFSSLRFLPTLCFFPFLHINIFNDYLSQFERITTNNAMLELGVGSEKKTLYGEAKNQHSRKINRCAVYKLLHSLYSVEACIPCSERKIIPHTEKHTHANTSNAIPSPNTCYARSDQVYWRWRYNFMHSRMQINLTGTHTLAPNNRKQTKIKYTI